MNASTINQKLFETKKAKIQIYPCHNLRASSLGHPCERYLYLSIKNWDEQKPHDVGLQCIFDLGNTLEDYTISSIKEAGFEIVTPAVRRWKINNPYISGREDIRIKDDDGNLYPVEIKGISPYEFDKLNTIDDFFKSRRPYIRGYPAQLQVYMLHFEKEKGYFALTNKLTGETKFIEMPFDYDYAESLLQKAERIYKALKNNIPPDSCDDISCCENCKLQHICGECRRIPTDIDLDDELDALIAKKQELAPSKKEYEQIDRQIKEKVGDRKKVITGQYLIEQSTITKKAFSVPESTQYRMQIKKL